LAVLLDIVEVGLLVSVLVEMLADLMGNIWAV
jgi:hypothetical protein